MLKIKDNTHTSEASEKEERYIISFSVNPSSVVDVQVDWPHEEVDENMAENIAYLLYALNNGKMKKMTVDSMTESIIQQEGLEDIVTQVITKWIEIQNKNSPEPCIRPSQTLGK